MKNNDKIQPTINWTIGDKWKCPKGLYLNISDKYKCKNNEICCVQNLYTFPINPYCCKKKNNGENFDSRCKVTLRKTR